MRLQAGGQTDAGRDLEVSWYKGNDFFNPKDMKDEGDAAGQEVEYQPSDRFDTPFETN